jgi:hypothetical protein
MFSLTLQSMSRDEDVTWHVAIKQINRSEENGEQSPLAFGRKCS